MDGPAIAPGGQIGSVEHFVESQAVRDAEVTQQFVGRALEDHVTLIDDRDPVELVQLTEIMNDADEALMMRLREITQQRQDLVLGLRIQARGDLVADHAGRVEGEFQPEGETTELAARKSRDPLIAVRRHAGHAKHGLEATGPLGGVGHRQFKCVFKGFRDRQLRLSGGKLWGETDLPDEVLGAGDALAREAGFPGRRQDTQDGLHQGRLAATGRPDDGIEPAGQEAGVGAVEDDGAVGARPHGEVLAAQHRLQSCLTPPQRKGLSP